MQSNYKVEEEGGSKEATRSERRVQKRLKSKKKPAGEVRVLGGGLSQPASAGPVQAGSAVEWSQRV